MPIYHADAIRNRERVYIHHDATDYPIKSGAVFASLDDALNAIRTFRIDWDAAQSAIRVRYETRCSKYMLVWNAHVCIRFTDSRDRPINHDIVYARAEALRNAAYRTRHARGGQRRYSSDEFRGGPVPCTGKRNRIRWRRRISTTAERRAAVHLAYDDDCLEYHIRPRARRNMVNLPSSYDDPSRGDYFNNGWKANRLTQWKGR